MKKSVSLLLVGMLINSVAWAADGYKVTASEQEGQRWFFKNLKALEENGIVKVRGRMTALNHIALPGGHIDVAVYAPNGKLVQETTTDYTPSNMTYKTKLRGGVRFSVDIKKPIPDGSVIKVAFHEDKWDGVKPSHVKNIAK